MELNQLSVEELMVAYVNDGATIEVNDGKVVNIVH